MEEKIVNDIEKITTIRLFKKVMIKLFRGYPAYEYFGIFESYFGEELGKQIVDIIKKDGLIEVIQKTKKEQIKYRLSASGINFAISMINLQHSEKVMNYSEQMKKFTLVVIILGALTLFAGIIQMIFI